MAQQAASATSTAGFEQRSDKQSSLLRRTLSDLVHNPMGLIGLLIVLSLLLLGVCAPLLARHDPLQQFRATGCMAHQRRFGSARTNSAAISSAARCTGCARRR